MATRIGLQLYSIRSAMAEDFLGSLAKVRAAGYDCVEFAGYGGFSATELRRELQQIGLEPYSSHVGYEQLEQHLEAVVAYSTELGLSWVVCPGYPINSAEDCSKLAAILVRAAQALQPYGIKVAYHNHDAEFRRFADRYALDLILDNAGNVPVAAELDLCWAQYANVDPVAYLDSLGTRAGPIHCKDINANYHELTGDQINVEVGGGMIDFPGIIAVAGRNGILDNGLIVEQEAFTRDMFESIRISHDYLRNLLTT